MEIVLFIQCRHPAPKGPEPAAALLARLCRLFSSTESRCSHRTKDWSTSRRSPRAVSNTTGTSVPTAIVTCTRYCSHSVARSRRTSIRSPSLCARRRLWLLRRASCTRFDFNLRPSVSYAHLQPAWCLKSSLQAAILRTSWNGRRCLQSTAPPSTRPILKGLATCCCGSLADPRRDGTWPYAGSSPRCWPTSCGLRDCRIRQCTANQVWRRPIANSLRAFGDSSSCDTGNTLDLASTPPNWGYHRPDCGGHASA